MQAHDLSQWSSGKHDLDGNAEPRGPVRRLLDLTGLIGVFSVHASVEEAVRAAGGSRLVVTAG
ncbi:MAG TPA: hypothetical protein VJ305_12415 [Streptosporangiaceae bacterium]|nr:hypothetical protein [Streptosporangiaceae bacterium]